MTLTIGTLKLDNPTIMAPLAGITNLPFRLMAKQAGCGLVYSEMISANGFAYQSEKTVRLMDSDPREKPVAMQIFGDKPEFMANIAAFAVAAKGADIIDINMGCSVKKVLKTGAGVALMKDPEKIEKILTGVRKAIQVPLTVKIRSGWDASGDQAVIIAKIAETCGVDAIAVHPRTAAQGFSGTADRTVIKRVKDAVQIPVIGNGDIHLPSDALDMMTQTGCDAVMIGRAAMGDPDLFRRTRALIQTGRVLPPDLTTHFNHLKSFLDMTVAYCGETHAPKMMRSRFSFFVKGLPGATSFRKAATRLTTKQEALKLIDDYTAILFSPNTQNRLYHCERYLKEPFTLYPDADELNKK